MRLEAASLQEAIRISEQTQAEEEAKNRISDFSNLLNALTSPQNSDFWTIINRDGKVFFLDLELHSAPAVRSSVIVPSDLQVEVFFGETRLSKCGDVLVPDKLCDLRDLKAVLHTIEEFHRSICTEPSQKIRNLLQFVATLLDEVSGEHFACKLQDWHLEVLKFLKSQVDLVLNNANRYSPDFLVFASLFYTILPHAYKFLRSSIKLKLPHPDTIRRLCSSYDVSPATEQQESNFLSYAKRVVNTYKEHERTVNLMIDEVHLQAYFDYKAGFVTGAAANSSNPAKTAHVFMVQSLVSPNKDVVNILPVAQIDARMLHDLLRKLSIDLEATGFRIVALISDNNSITEKLSHSLLSPQVSALSTSILPIHRAPFFFVVDPIHLLKCIRNNWLNQRNSGKCMYFPDPESTDAKPKILTASFKVLCQLHETEKNELLKITPTLTLKALNPSNMERQNVKLALKIFSSSTVAALNTISLQHAQETSKYIDTILRWLNVVNVKTPKKGQRLRDEFQGPIMSSSCPQLEYLSTVVRWLDHWPSLKHGNGHLTRETHSAFSHTTHALYELAKYCLEELRFTYVLLGKFQTDSLEDRFGKYRQLSGVASLRSTYDPGAVKPTSRPIALA
ncbi:hypothetical protein HPB48_018685 [Haemaphysalis longicornis]|uniref:Transposable element n=1 Tax=Haemaphysalis longicornis TaxID=44386 RepID=A0A9J6FNS3_HAELO|nr:hypothetical protein HPB48_018685 [Haemaphysalis longicornis]